MAAHEEVAKREILTVIAEGISRRPGPLKLVTIVSLLLVIVALLLPTAGSPSPPWGDGVGDLRGVALAEQMMGDVRSGDWRRASLRLGAVPPQERIGEALAEVQQVVEREQSLAPQLDAVMGLLLLERYAAAYELYEDIPIDSYAFLVARAALADHVDDLASAFAAQVDELERVGELERARRARSIALRLDPTLEIAEPSLTATPPPTRPMPVAARRDQTRDGVSASRRLYMQGDLTAAIRNLRAAPSLDLQGEELLSRLEQVQRLQEAVAALGTPRDARLRFEQLDSAAESALVIDHKRASPITREILGELAGSLLFLGDQALRRGGDGGYREAIELWQRGLGLGERSVAFRERLDRLDGQVGEECYKPLYRRWEAGSLNRETDGDSIRRCIALSPEDGEYHQKARSLLAQVQP